MISTVLRTWSLGENTFAHLASSQSHCERVRMFLLLWDSWKCQGFGLSYGAEALMASMLHKKPYITAKGVRGKSTWVRVLSVCWWARLVKEQIQVWIQDFGQGAQWSFDPRGARAQNMLKIAWKLRDFEKILGTGGPAPLDPQVRSLCLLDAVENFLRHREWHEVHILSIFLEFIWSVTPFCKSGSLPRWVFIHLQVHHVFLTTAAFPFRANARTPV